MNFGDVLLELDREQREPKKYSKLFLRWHHYKKNYHIPGYYLLLVFYINCCLKGNNGNPQLLLPLTPHMCRIFTLLWSRGNQSQPHPHMESKHNSSILVVLLAHVSNDVLL